MDRSRCCDAVATSDAALSQDISGFAVLQQVALPANDLEAAFIIAFAGILPSAIDVMSRYRALADPGWHHLRPIYLQTARLRL